MVKLAHRIGRGSLDAEDLAQEVLERWTRAAPHLPPNANPRAWMTVVLRRLAIDQLRRRSVWSTVSADERRLPEVDREPSPWWHELDVTDVVRVLGELPETLRGAFQQFALEGKSYDEIARDLRIAKATVGVRVLRARLQLRRLLSARHAPAVDAPPGSGSTPGP